MEGFQFQFADFAFLIAFILLGIKMYMTIKKLNRTTYQDPNLHPHQRDEAVEESTPVDPHP